MANVTKKRIVSLIAGGLALLLILNLPPASIIINAVERDDCVYSTADGGFVCHEYRFKDNTFENHCLPVFEGFKKFVKDGDIRYRGSDTSQLFRVNSRNWLKIWRYHDYVFGNRYQVAFKSWDEIKGEKNYNNPYVR